jgi:Flp pilus assembly protein TadG
MLRTKLRPLRTRLATLIRARDGMAAVEFAILGSVTLMIAFAIIELGRYAFTEYSVERAVRAGVRYAVVSGAGSAAPATAATLQESVLTALTQMGLTRTDASVDANPFPTGNSSGKPVVVAVTYTFRPVLPMPMKTTLAIRRSMQATILN